EGLGKLMTVVQSLAPKIKKAVGAEGVLIQQFNGAVAGQTVFHLHVHIVPRKEGVPLRPEGAAMADPEGLKAIAEKIRAVLGE
ncbi:MAG: HIT family protein, partial [Methyloceanibacter sp.]